MIVAVTPMVCYCVSKEAIDCRCSGPFFAVYLSVVVVAGDDAE